MKNGTKNGEKRPIGRPKSDNPRCCFVRVNLRMNEYNALKEAAEEYGMTISDILRRGMWLELHELETLKMRKIAEKTPL